MKKSIKVAVSLVTAMSLSLGASTASSAAEVPPETIDELIANAPYADLTVEHPETTSDSSVSIASETDGTISFSQEEEASLSIALPSNAEFVTDTATELDGETVVTSQYMTSDEAAHASARAVLAIPDADAPSSYDFELQAPEGTKAEHNSDGSITLVSPGAVQQDGVQVDRVIAEINAPWAVDANGVAVPTSYTFDGETLTQNIDFSAVTAFPVVADPKVDWMGYFVRLTYTKAETRNMRDQGVIIGAIVGAGAAIAAAAGPAAPAIIAAVYAASTIAVGIIATTASNAVGDGKCLQLDIPSMYPSIVKCRA